MSSIAVNENKKLKHTHTHNDLKMRFNAAVFIFGISLATPCYMNGYPHYEPSVYERFDIALDTQCAST